RYGAEIGDGGRRHDPLADDRLVEPSLDKDGVNDSEARGREGDPGDLGLSVIPAKAVIGEETDHDKRRRERDKPDRERHPPLPAELRHVDLCTGEEREDDTGEGAEKREPSWDGQREGVADDEAARQLDQADREADLDRDHRGDEDGSREKCRYR